MSKTLERRLNRLLAKQRSFDFWSLEKLDRAIQLYLRAPEGLTQGEEEELRRYTARMPPVPAEIAAMPAEVVDRQIEKLKENLGFGVK